MAKIKKAKRGKALSDAKRETHAERVEKKLAIRDAMGQEKLFEASHPLRGDILRRARKYVKIRDERMALTRDEVTARDGLVEFLRSNGLKDGFTDGTFSVSLVTKDKLKVSLDGGGEPIVDEVEVSPG